MGWDGMPASRDRTGPRDRRPEAIRVVAMVSSRTYGFLLDALSRRITAATVSVSPIQASRALSGLPIEASVLVIEPEYLAEASAREKIALPLLVDSINCAFAARTLLLCGCTANSLRTLHGLAGLRRSELFVLEVDGAQLLSSLIVNSNASAASGDPHGVLGSLEALPPTIREILMSAATAPLTRRAPPRAQMTHVRGTFGVVPRTPSSASPHAAACSRTHRQQCGLGIPRYPN